MELPYPDAKVAGLLCMGGPCKYIVKEGSGVTNYFLLHHVTPHIAQRFPESVTLVLAKALLWMSLSQNGGESVPENIYNRIHNAYRNARVLDQGINPIDKIPLVISGHEGEVYMDPVVNVMGNAGGSVEGNGNGAAAGAFAERPVRQQLMALYSVVMQLCQSVDILRTNIEEDRVTQT